MAPVKRAPATTEAVVAKGEVLPSMADRLAARKDLVRAQRELLDQELDDLERTEAWRPEGDVREPAALQITTALQYGAQLVALAALFVFWIAAGMMRDHLRRFHPESQVARQADPEETKAEPGS